MKRLEQAEAIRAGQAGQARELTAEERAAIRAAAEAKAKAREAEERKAALSPARSLEIALAHLVKHPTRYLFPIRPGGKKPSIKDMLNLASNSAAQIRQWAKDFPGCNWGAAPRLSRIQPVDIDTKENKIGLLTIARIEADLMFDIFPETEEVRTPTGGIHKIYEGEPVYALGNAGFGTDVDSPQYILIPGCRTPEGEYTLVKDIPAVAAPEWFYHDELLGKAKKRRERGEAPDAEYEAAYTGEQFAEVMNMLDPEAFNERGKWLDLLFACAHASTVEDGEETFMDWTIKGSGYDGDWDVVTETWADAYQNRNKSDGLQVGTFNMFLREAGVPDELIRYPGDTTAADDFGDEDIEDFETELERKAAEEAAFPQPLPIGELRAGDHPRQSYIVADLVMKDTVNMFYGNGGTGKTTVTIQMGLAIAAGVPIFERETIQAPVLLVLGEDDYGETKARLEAAIEDLGIAEPDKLPLHVWCLPGYDISIAKVDEEGTATMLSFYHRLDKWLGENPGAFVALDSLADIAQMGEAGRLAPNTFFKKVLGGLVVKHKATLMVLGHPSKAAMADGSYFSGSTAYRNAVRNMIVIKEINGTRFRSLDRLKNNYASDKAGIRVGWSDGIFQMVDKGALAADERVRYEAVLRVVADLRANRIDVARDNRGGGQTPRTVAEAVNRTLQPDNPLTWKEVEAIMKRAEAEGDLVYRPSNGKTRATYRTREELNPAFPRRIEIPEGDEADDAEAFGE